MKQEALDRLKALHQFVESSRTWWARYRDTVCRPSCDKYDARFNGDDRFPVLTLKRLQFTAFTGYFGNSGCSTFGRMNSQLAEHYLPKAMTALAPELFAKMAELAELDATNLNAEAQKELASLQSLVAAASQGTVEAE